jgi:hypothetical protein
VPYVSRPGSTSPDVLPGRSGATLILTGFYYKMGAILTGCLAVAESYLPGRWYYWGGAIFLGICILVSLSVANTLRGNRRLAEENRRGYTTVPGDAIKDPSLYYLDRKTLRVLAGPYEPRPRRRVTS